MLKGLATRRPGNARTLRSNLVQALDLALRHGAIDRNSAAATAPVPRDDELRAFRALLATAEIVAAQQAACVLRVHLATAWDAVANPPA